MRNIVLNRVDDRLIHGEVVTAWQPFCNADHIVIVDDVVANDKFNKRVLTLLAPANTKIEIYSVEEAAENLKGANDPKERVIVLTKTPISFERLFDLGVDIKEVNLGGMGIRDDRKPFINNVSASPDEVDSIRRMKNEKGINVYYQLVPEQKVSDISSLL